MTILRLLIEAIRYGNKEDARYHARTLFHSGGR